MVWHGIYVQYMYQKKGVTKKVAETEFKVVTKKVVEAKKSCNQKGQVKRKKKRPCYHRDSI